MWEAFTHCSRKLYENFKEGGKLSKENLKDFLNEGGRLDSKGISPQVYQIMKQCWEEDPQKRPSFSQLKKHFKLILKHCTSQFSQPSLLQTSFKIWTRFENQVTRSETKVEVFGSQTVDELRERICKELELKIPGGQVVLELIGKKLKGRLNLDELKPAQNKDTPLIVKIFDPNENGDL